jgi:KaiC/GvpD/RAD55 family RecA-like ATPase
MGVLIARAGVGKTACLINIALHKLMENCKVVHVSIGEGPEKIHAYYQVLLNELINACKMKEDDAFHQLLENNRIILSYVNKSFELARLRAQLENLKEALDFSPDVLLVDGLDFATTDPGLFEDFATLAGEVNAEIWFSALSHRHMAEVNQRGIPYPCDKVDDMFSVILHLQPEEGGLYLKLLKDQENESVSGRKVRLVPSTFMIADE